ncbi:MAG: bifunctional glutamate N-acetyltransferase/amino-acid acetyltransferase ArgJ [Deltaproteobacteria bacterium]|nr:bifunctional glutamate N-acetyltransferase/amino-acid acetyltransferase ArgJ [Deltaproteobacteria bacterium]
MEISGFKSAAVAAGIRYKDRLDLGLIAADEPVAVAGVFTRNKVQAAPVVWTRDRVRSGYARAIAVNSGQANACTGPEGMDAAAGCARAVAEALGCKEDEVLLASTGVIGEALNIEAFKNAVPELAAGLAGDKLSEVSRAIMTTDTRPKLLQAGGEIDGKAFNIAGIAKGAGMIAPNMATMLCFVLTDAAIAPEPLQDTLKQVAENTFNRITIDGDTSTNDTILIMASGKAGFDPLTPENKDDLERFERALTKILAGLARMIVADGEGATKLVNVVVNGAVDDGQAKIAAMSVANSPLVKTALFGEDPNWGRIMMALGKSAAEFDPEKVDISFDRAALVKNGRMSGLEAEAAAVMRQDEFSLNIDLSAGEGRAEVLTCDFSHDYVSINADYRS